MEIGKGFTRAGIVNMLLGRKGDSGRKEQRVNLPSLDECQALLTCMSRLGYSCALQTWAEWKASTKLVQCLGLPSHHDERKNWDTLKALYYILTLRDVEAPVLDAGASADSAILKWLGMLGYRQRYACDIRAKDKRKYAARNIQFSVQDLTQTDYPDEFFQAVTSISVIEHNVSLEGYIHEMARILRRGGLLLTSTDYWSAPIDCTGIFPYGREMGEMKVFQRRELEELVADAERRGFCLCSPLNLETRERAVRWDRVDREYTFAFIALRKFS